MPSIVSQRGITLSEILITLLILGAALLIGFLVAFSVGANDETMTPAVGAGLLSLGIAVTLGGILNFIGAFFLGQTVSKTVGKNLTTPDFTLSLSMVFIILISMAIWLTLVSLRGVPISTTQSIVGAVLGVVLVEIFWSFLDPAVAAADKLTLAVINYPKLLEILLSWIVSPIIGFVGGFVFYWIIVKLRSSINRRGYADYERQEKIFMWGLALFLLITVFSRSGNDVAKAIGPLMAIPEFEQFPGIIFALIAGGFGMCLGVIVLGRRVVKKLATDIVALSPSSALAASISVSIIMFFGTILGFPLSGSHILVAAFIGVGIVNREKVDTGPLKEIGVSWIVTTPISAALAGGIYLIVRFAFQIVATVFPV